MKNLRRANHVGERRFFLDRDRSRTNRAARATQLYFPRCEAESSPCSRCIESIQHRRTRSIECRAECLRSRWEPCASIQARTRAHPFDRKIFRRCRREIASTRRAGFADREGAKAKSRDSTRSNHPSCNPRRARRSSLDLRN